MAGSATLTMVMSSSSMNVAVHAASRVHHLGAMAGLLPDQPRVEDLPARGRTAGGVGRALAPRRRAVTAGGRPPAAGG